MRPSFGIRAGLAIALTVGSPALASAQSCVGPVRPDTTRLIVEATNLRNAAGEVAFTVHTDSRSRFQAKGGKLLRARVPARAPVTRACFNRPPGSYALANHRDENRDRDFNRTLLAPKEGLGFSNDAPTSIGLSSLSAARFALPPAGRLLRMRTRYRR